MGTKKCPRCLETFEFPDDKSPHSYCPTCRNEYNKSRYRANREKIIQYNKDYYEKNREKILKRQKRYYETHREQVLEYQSRHYRENKDEITEYKKRYRALKAKSNKVLKITQSEQENCQREHNNCFSCTYSDCIYP